MHSLYFVRLKKADNSAKAQDEAAMILDGNNFASEGGFFSSSKADWYSVGGRWSGVFSRYTPEYKAGLEAIKPLLAKQLEKSPDLLGYLHINSHMLTPELKAEVEQMFRLASGGIAYFRADLNSGAFLDDAVLVDQTILDTLKKEYGACEVLLVDEADDIEDEAPVNALEDADLLGSWLVIIDYHS